MCHRGSSGPIHVRFWWTVAPGHVSPQVLRVSPISIIPSMVRTNIHPHVALARRAKLGNRPKSGYVSEIGELWLEKYSHLTVDTPLRLLQAVAFLEVHFSFQLLF